ncbi:importin beta-like SAD2 homolog isoform X2 [Ziziphus jujuba]|uniref:Importin beta-like SAD2 homolog isoform X2 n=1 Tax=Ziziphus jujuba TaxID=326968 RepID=A0A6P4BLZ4_ZIZJJ|nr:importin beta-like SAD2 homolog isoform X2 [Ziziphus jujuba]
MDFAVRVAQLLSQTLSPDCNAVKTAAEALDRLSLMPQFPFSLLSIATGGENEGQKMAAATYFKNFTRRNIDGGIGSSPHPQQCSKVGKELKDQLFLALLQVQPPPVLKVLVEAFRIIVVAEFVDQNSWSELVPDLRTAIQNSSLISNGMASQWSTINALTLLHALLRPFQYFLNPKVAKEPVPVQLELIAKEILVPLLAVFHQFVEKACKINCTREVNTETALLIVCKCMYFAVKSHMPSALAPLLPVFCHDLISILGSLTFHSATILEEGYLMRLKTGKRSLQIFCALVTRHRKYSDKLMPDMINNVLGIAKCSSNISKLDFVSERIISLAFDVISHILETGPGWRLVSPHFSSLLDSAIFPALVMNEKDISEWEEDADEFLRKNLPSDLEEVSGWREDLFTARKSAINLLGVISMSKGPPTRSSSNGSSAPSKRKKGEKSKQNNQRSSIGDLLVLPFLSKFPVPSEANAIQSGVLNNYFGVLMAYGGQLDFLREQEPRYTETLVRTRLLPLYTFSVCQPYLVATANWVLGELASCLTEEMSTNVYSSLLKALAMPDNRKTSCYPVRISAAGAIAKLLESDYPPPEWLPLLQVVIDRIGNDDEESSVLFQLLSSMVETGEENVAVHIPYVVSSLVGALSKCIPHDLEPWPQMLEKGFSALAVMAQSWESFLSEEFEQNERTEKWASCRATIGRAFSSLLQHFWLANIHPMESGATPSCIDNASTLLCSIMLSVTESNDILELKISELLIIWADLIARWHAWEESEDMAVFECINEVVNLESKYGLKDFIQRLVPSPPAPPVPRCSVFEGIGAFISEAILQYPSATWRACSSVHMLLHVPSYSSETEGVKQALAITFSRALLSRFRKIQDKPCSLWKPLLLAMSSCYLCYPETVKGVLEKDEVEGFTNWASNLCHISSSSFESAMSTESEIRLIVMVLVKVIESLMTLGKSYNDFIQGCFTSLMDASIRLKEMQEEKDEEAEEDEEAENDEEFDDETEDDDEDSEAEDNDETEEEFLNRYAKAAAALQSGVTIEEGDMDDEDHAIELGCLEGIDLQRLLFSLIARYHPILIQEKTVAPQLISSFLGAYPECRLFFEQPTFR